MPRFSLVFLTLFTLLRTVGLPEAVLGNESLKSVTRQAYLMGTKVHLSVRTSDRAAGLIQLEQMLKVLEKTEAELSTWRAESLVSRLNRHPINQVWHADLEFCNLFKKLARWHQETNGAFDPVVGDLLHNQENESNISEPSTKALFGFKYLMHR